MAQSKHRRWRPPLAVALVVAGGLFIEGYPEGQAIRIAITQARQWARGVTFFRARDQAG